jgi:hypothetical protein
MQDKVSWRGTIAAGSENEDGLMHGCTWRRGSYKSRYSEVGAGSMLWLQEQVETARGEVTIVLEVEVR